MREIKFRAWDKEEKAWISPTDVKIDGRGYLFLERNLFPPQAGYYTEDRFDICFYTGLKDKNGKEIYGGDILGCHDNVKRWKSGDGERAIVEWDKNKSRWGMMFHSIYGGEGHLCAEESLNSRVRFEWVVIGNIYENPELLELGPTHDQ
jgi:uncharacterized phage protein (TIGR01671 family)